MLPSLQTGGRDLRQSIAPVQSLATMQLRLIDGLLLNVRGAVFQPYARRTQV